jgi:hypothetical protein
VIGGVDIEYPTNAGPAALEHCVRAVLLFWPRPYIEDCDTGERYDGMKDVPLGLTTELLVYRDAEIAARWDELGAAPELADTMMHLLYDPGFVNVVVDDPDSDVARPILAAIEVALRADLFSIPTQATRVAA